MAGSAVVADEIQRVIDVLASRLGRNVAVDDLSFRLIAYTPHVGDIDDMRARVVLERQAPPEAVAWLQTFRLARATGPVRLPANADLGTLPRVVLPVRSQGIDLGYLWLIDAEGDLNDAEVAQAAATADEVGEILVRERVLADLRTAREGELVRDLLAPDAADRRVAVERLVESGMFAPRGGVVALVAQPVPVPGQVVEEPDRLALAMTLDDVVAQLAPRSALRLVRPEHAVLVVAEAALRRARALPERVHARCAERLPKGRRWQGVVVGVGSPVPTLEQVGESYRHAVQAAKVASIVPSFAPVARHEDLGIYSLLAGLPRDQLESLGVHPGVQRLLDTDRVLFETVELFLDLAGDAVGVAERQVVHRATVFRRIQRASEITGADFADGQDRLVLHLGVKLARLLGHV